MDTSWWPALGGVALLALVAALVDGIARTRPARRRRKATRRDPAARDAAVLPRPGEIWHAGPRDGAERLVLVLAARTDGVRLARLTREPSPLCVLPDGAPGGPAYLEPESVAEAGLARLTSRHGEVAPEVWERVRHLAG